MTEHQQEITASLASKPPPKKGTTEGRKLDAREARFVDEYLVDLDVERAAIAAGYSATMAKTKAYQWVSSGKGKPHVLAVVRARQLKLSNKLAVTQERVLQELARISFLDIRKAFDAEGNLKPIADFDDDTAAAIAGLEIDVTHSKIPAPDGTPAITTTTSKIKLSDKKGALDSLARHLGMFKDDVSRLGIDITHYMAHDQKIIDRYNEKRAQAPITIENKPTTEE